MINVLVVEDEKPIRMLTRAKLKNKYNIYEAANGVEALDVMEHNHMDIIIADIMMPEMDGYELVQLIRESHDNIPVIFLTAMNSFEHKRKAFQTGIDDYMTKPIDYDELIWRMEALLRRAQIATQRKVEIGEFSISEDTRSIEWKGETIALTDKEFNLLYKLLSYPGVIFTKQQIMDEIWGYDSESDYSTIKTYVNRLRKKCGDCDAFEIQSIRGLGYKAVIHEVK